MPEGAGSTEMVFISYSSRNRRIAEAIKSHLQSLHVDCWMAPESIMPGEQWAQSISRTIPQCRLMVLLWTVESMQSEQVINELTLADRSGVMIIPFRVDDIEPEGAFKYYLYKTHWLDAFDGWKHKLDLLGERVLHNLEGPPLAPSTESTVVRRGSAFGRALGAGQLISIAAATLAVAAALVTVMIPNLTRKPAVVVGADEAGADQLADCEVSRLGKDVLRGPCRFRQFGGNGSFSLYPAVSSQSFEGGLTSLTLTVNSPGVGEMKGLVRNGNAEGWGGAKQDVLEQACWKGEDFRLCVYAQADTSSTGR